MTGQQESVGPWESYSMSKPQWLTDIAIHRTTFHNGQNMWGEASLIIIPDPRNGFLPFENIFYLSNLIGALSLRLLLPISHRNAHTNPHALRNAKAEWQWTCWPRVCSSQLGRNAIKLKLIYNTIQRRACRQLWVSPWVFVCKSVWRSYIQAPQTFDSLLSLIELG